MIFAMKRSSSSRPRALARKRLRLPRSELLLLRARLRLRVRQRQGGALPTVGAVGIPRHIGVTVRENALCRVPRHPAVGLAIDHEQPRAVATGSAIKPALQIVFGRCRELSIAGVRQPDTTGNIAPWFFAPDRAFGKILRLWRTRQHVDENTRSRAPDGL